MTVVGRDSGNDIVNRRPTTSAEMTVTKRPTSVARSMGEAWSTLEKENRETGGPGAENKATLDYVQSVAARFSDARQFITQPKVEVGPHGEARLPRPLGGGPADATKAGAGGQPLQMSSDYAAAY